MKCAESSPGVEECALRARSTYGVHHAIVEVNIVIGVVLGELHVVVRVDPVVVCDDAVVRSTLVLIALCRRLCFRRIFFFKDFAVWEKYNLQKEWRGTASQDKIAWYAWA